MQFKIHNEGWVYLVSTIILTIIVTPFFNILGIFFGILSFYIFYFFRDPERSIPLEDFIVSPADGVIDKIEINKPPINFDNNENFTKISIFLSIFDVHVNRMPVNGNIKNILYVPGKFLNASLNKSSEQNERNIIHIVNNSQNFFVVQIAGLIARRIVCELTNNQDLKKGDRIGIIKFGSRVDLYIPQNHKLLVSKGQKVIGGETIISNPKKIEELKKTIKK